MRISELIRSLTEIKLRHGDEHVLVYNPNGDDYHRITDVLWSEEEEVPLIEIGEDQ